MGFRGILAQEPISALELREAIVVHPETVVRAAVARMRSRRLGCAVIADYIADPHAAPCGIFTEQSLIDALMQNESLDDHTVSDFADSKFMAVKHSEPILRVWDAIQRDGLRFVCVTDDEDKIVNITGQRGIAEYVAANFPQQVFVQRLGSTPWMQQREGA